MSCRGECAAVQQDLPERLGFIGDPGVECGQEGVAVDEVVLESEQAEQQARGRRSHAVYPAARNDRRVRRRHRRRRGRPGTGGGILRESGVFACALAELALDAEELLEQEGAARSGLLGQEVLDARSVAALFPVALEAIGGLVDPGSFAGRGVAHRDPVWPRMDCQGTPDPSSGAGTGDLHGAGRGGVPAGSRRDGSSP